MPSNCKAVAPPLWDSFTHMHRRWPILRRRFAVDNHFYCVSERRDLAKGYGSTRKYCPVKSCASTRLQKVKVLPCFLPHPCTKKSVYRLSSEFRWSATNTRTFILWSRGFHLSLPEWYMPCRSNPPGSHRQGELSLGMETAIHTFIKTMHTLEGNTMQFLTIADSGTRLTRTHGSNGKLSKLKNVSWLISTHEVEQSVAIYNVLPSTWRPEFPLQCAHIDFCYVFITTAISVIWSGHFWALRLFCFDSSAFPCILNRDLTVVHFPTGSNWCPVASLSGVCVERL